jgi:hypothetical protein
MTTEPLQVTSPPVSRILSGALLPRDDHPSGTAIARRLLRPTRDLIGGPPVSLLGLAPGGVCRAARSPGRWWSLTPPFHPCLCRDACAPGHRRSALCCTFRRVAPPGCYPASCPVESGLSSTRLRRGGTAVASRARRFNGRPERPIPGRSGSGNAQARSSSRPAIQPAGSAQWRDPSSMRST